MLTATTMINASPTEVYQFLEDLDSWPIWNDDIQDTSLPHGFSYGSSGWITVKNRIHKKLQIVHIDYARSFTMEIRCTFCTIVLETKLKIWRGQTEATIEARFKGFLAPLCKRLHRDRLQQFIRTTLDGLNNASEQGLPATASQSI
ncbi:SRPBCC family protein [Brucella anthropi]|uniref:SRPBCC family protein n=1 Tax=Brucella anthropi TaxID=529 RepID=UPI000CFC7B52|nr:SRPBCC family protein [Ochrobactrum sp. MYb49]PQZ61769.1 hypothetical protein CQ057_22540 [Ochrobactrum sp. MYb49]